MRRLEWVCMASFLRHGAEFHLFTDDLERKVPDGVVLRDSRTLIGRNPVRYSERSGKKGSLAMAADIARMKWLRDNGGWWVDMDVVCLKSFAPIDEGTKIGWQRDPIDASDAGEANVAVMRITGKSPLARILYRRAMWPWFGSPWESWRERLRNFWELKGTIKDRGDVPWGWSAGPAALTAVLNHLGMRSSVLPSTAFYPIAYPDWRQILELTPQQLAELGRNSYALHVWAEMFRGSGVDTDASIRDCSWAQPYLEGYPESGGNAS
jgi:hypothetical protein